MTTLPTWAVYALGFGSPVLSFLGVIVSVWLSRRGDTELEDRSKREEVMRNLRWAAELAVSDDEAKAELGVNQLKALADSDLLDDSHMLFIDAALESVILDVAEAIDEIEASGAAAEIVADLTETDTLAVSLAQEGGGGRWQRLRRSM